jgi:hypothetical protein
VKATVRVTNGTHWRTDHLAAFVRGARREVFGSELKPLRVTFAYSRKSGRVSGRASVGGSWSRILIPRASVNKSLLARLLIHELSHNAGLRVEREMPKVHTGGVPWAEALPLESKPAKPAPSPGDRIDLILSNLTVREKFWSTKAKRAATALAKLKRQRAYYTRKLAAVRADVAAVGSYAPDGSWREHKP